MDHQATMLREQASVLRALADSFDNKEIRQRLLKVAQRCEELAETTPQDRKVAELHSISMRTRANPRKRAPRTS